MNEPCELHKDSRRISGVYWHDGEEGYTVGQSGVTSIIPYREAGQMAEIPWLAVYSNEMLIARVNCASVCSIVYFT